MADKWTANVFFLNYPDIFLAVVRASERALKTYNADFKFGSFQEIVASLQDYEHLKRTEYEAALQVCKKKQSIKVYNEERNPYYQDLPFYKATLALLKDKDVVLKVCALEAYPPAVLDPIEEVETGLQLHNLPQELTQPASVPPQ